MKKVQIFIVVFAIIGIVVYSCGNHGSQTIVKIIATGESFLGDDESGKDGDTVVVQKLNDNPWSINPNLDYRQIRDTIQNCGDYNITVRVAVVEIISNSAGL